MSMPVWLKWAVNKNSGSVGVKWNINEEGVGTIKWRS